MLEATLLNHRVLPGGDGGEVEARREGVRRGHEAVLEGLHQQSGAAHRSYRVGRCGTSRGGQSAAEQREKRVHDGTLSWENDRMVRMPTGTDWFAGPRDPFFRLTASSVPHRALEALVLPPGLTTAVSRQTKGHHAEGATSAAGREVLRRQERSRGGAQAVREGNACTNTIAGRLGLSAPAIYFCWKLRSRLCGRQERSISNLTDGGQEAVPGKGEARVLTRAPSDAGRGVRQSATACRSCS